MGLRLNEGISLSAITAKTGADCLIHQKKADMLKDQGLILISEDRIALTEQGFPLLDAILAEIVAA